MFKVRKKVPVPSIVTNRKSKYNWPALEVGDSFVMSAEEVKRAGSLARQHYADLGQSITIRRQADGTYGVWRLAGKPRSRKNETDSVI